MLTEQFDSQVRVAEMDARDAVDWLQRMAGDI